MEDSVEHYARCSRIQALFSAYSCGYAASSPLALDHFLGLLPTSSTERALRSSGEADDSRNVALPTAWLARHAGCLYAWSRLLNSLRHAAPLGSDIAGAFNVFWFDA